MSVLEIFLVGASLAMDALAVSLAASMLAQTDKKKLFAMPFVFAIFQMLMPVLGDAAGGLFREFISTYAPVAVFVILVAIGANMVKEGVCHIKNPESEIKALTWTLLFTQGIATSIDAFAVGIGFKATSTNIIEAVGIIGVVTLLICSVGVFFGKKAGEKLGAKAEIFGGVILCLIGIKAFLF